MGVYNHVVVYSYMYMPSSPLMVVISVSIRVVLTPNIHNNVTAFQYHCVSSAQNPENNIPVLNLIQHMKKNNFGFSGKGRQSLIHVHV